jgi:HEAT repeat protein
LAAETGDVEKAVRSLAGALEDSDLDVRELAAESLGQIGSQAKSGLPALELALDDPQPSVKHTAALAIYRIDPQAKSYQPLLSAALRAGDGPVFLEVGRMGSEAKWAVPTLTALLSDRRPQIRALAAHTLGEIGPVASDANAALQRTVRDPEASVRKTAQNALRQIGASASASAKSSR